MPSAKNGGSFLDAAKDGRVWALFVLYAACFGIELTINNILAGYFLDYFAFFKTMNEGHALQYAGAAAMLFGLMNIFARTMGGYFGDLFGAKSGLQGRVRWLFVAVFVEGSVPDALLADGDAGPGTAGAHSVQPVCPDERRCDL